MNEQWYSIVEYARTFSISDMTVRRHIKRGKIKAVLKDGKYYIPMTRPPVAPGMVMDAPSFEPHKPKDNVLYSAPVAPPVMPLQILKGSTSNDGPPKIALNRSERAVTPTHLATSLIQDSQSTGQDTALLDFCTKSLAKFQEMEKHVEDKYIHKIESLEQTIANRDLEIKVLKQTVEDLQLLVRIFEKKHT